MERLLYECQLRRSCNSLRLVHGACRALPAAPIPTSRANAAREMGHPFSWWRLARSVPRLPRPAREMNRRPWRARCCGAAVELARARGWASPRFSQGLHHRWGWGGRRCVR